METTTSDCGRPSTLPFYLCWHPSSDRPTLVVRTRPWSFPVSLCVQSRTATGTTTPTGLLRPQEGVSRFVCVNRVQSLRPVPGSPFTSSVSITLLNRRVSVTHIWYFTDDEEKTKGGEDSESTGWNLSLYVPSLQIFVSSQIGSTV